MRQAQIMVLKKIGNDYKKLKPTIINWLIKKEITVDDLLECCKNKKITLAAR